VAQKTRHLIDLPSLVSPPPRYKDLEECLDDKLVDARIMEEQPVLLEDAVRGTWGCRVSAGSVQGQCRVDARAADPLLNPQAPSPSPPT
jgi:hypothetical protein